MNSGKGVVWHYMGRYAESFFPSYDHYIQPCGSDCEACKGHLGASGGYFRAFGGQPSSFLPIKWKFDLRNAVSHLMRMKLKGTLSLNGHNLVIF